MSAQAYCKWCHSAGTHLAGCVVAATTLAAADAVRFDAGQPKRAATQGVKLDHGKPGWHLMPWRALSEVVRVLDYGAKKYAPDNWKAVPEARQRYFAAAQRHLVAWAEGEVRDPESGLHHLAHAACCLLFLLWREVQP